MFDAKKMDFIKKKLILILCDFGCIIWPELYPNFIQNLMFVYFINKNF